MIQRSDTVDDCLEELDVNQIALGQIFTRLYTKVFGKNFSRVYYDIFKFFVKSKRMINEKFLFPLIESFYHQLNTVIQNAPNTTFQFWVYRGIKGKDYVIVGDAKKYVFTNKLFMSTSFDLCQALQFKKEKDPCCLQQILVTKDLPCLLISCLSYFEYENEILFLPERHLYPLGNDFITTNVDVDTRKFVLTN